jgi:outer membrane protein assembly factor BamB
MARSSARSSPSRGRRCRLPAAAGAALAALTASAADWATLHGDLQRSGFYAEFPAGRLALGWRRDFSRELTGPRAEVIVSGGRAFLGTYAGRVYALDAATGEDVWRADLGAAIGHSVAVGEGSVFVASIDGRLRALDIDSGRVRWQVKGDGGFWTAPVFAEGWVFAGDRAGVFHAYDARRDGHEVWRLATDGPILTPASLSRDGSRVVFGSEDMHVYCVGTNTGEVAWKSAKLPGLSLRDYAPTIFRDLVFVTTNPVKDFHALLGGNEQMLVRRAGAPSGDPRFIAGTDEDVTREQDAIVAHLRARRDEQCFHALRVEDGTEPWVAPILYSGGCHNVMPPPCFQPATGEIFVQVRSAYGVWDGGSEVRAFTGVGRLDPATGRVSLLRHGYPSKDPARAPGAPDFPGSSFNCIGDETQALSCAPGLLFSNHQGFLGSFDLVSGRLENLWGRRDSYGGFLGPAVWGEENRGGRAKAAEAGETFALINEWHGPARSIASVADGRVFYHSGGQVLCLVPDPAAQ